MAVLVLPVDANGTGYGIGMQIGVIHLINGMLISKVFGGGNNSMKIKKIFIGDGSIIEYIYENQNLTMVFKDYEEISYEIKAFNCTLISVTGSSGFSLDYGDFIENKDGHRWRFYNEDGVVLELEFGRYTISQLTI